jgi:hypothetical protein
MNITNFHSRLFHFQIPRLGIVMLIALACSTPAFCGEIHDAAEAGDMAKVKALLKKNSKLVSSKDNDGDTPLHIAALNGHKDMLELLLANKADVNAKNKNGRTPLHWAAGYKNIAGRLLAKGAAVNAKDKNGRTPLHIGSDGSLMKAGNESALAGRIYDVAADFSHQSNPNGVWSYGGSQRRGSDFILASNPGTMKYGSTLDEVWVNSDQTIGVGYATADLYFRTGFVPAKTIHFHPGPTGQYSIVRWTAPECGQYQIDVVFTGRDASYPTTTDVHVLRGSKELFNGNINSYDDPLPFSIALTAEARETIDFTVGWGTNGNYDGDTTGLSITIAELGACTFVD